MKETSTSGFKIIDNHYKCIWNTYQYFKPSRWESFVTRDTAEINMRR